MGEVRYIRVGANNVAVDWILLSSSVNSIPSCQASFHVGKSDKAYDASSAEMLDIAAADQRASFEPRFSPDSEIRIDDGGGGQLVFTGYRTAPSYRMATGAAGRSVTIIHDASILNAYNPYIYDAVAGRKQGLEPKDDNVAQRALDLLDGQTKLWQGNGRIRSLDEYEEIKDAIHAVNSNVFQHVKKLLEDSSTTSTYGGMDKVASDHGGLNMTINGSILRTLMARRVDYFQNILALCSMWQMIYKPSKKAGEMGTLVSLEKALQHPQEREVICSDYNINAGPMSTLPVTGVLVEGVPSPNRKSAPSGNTTAPGGIIPGSIAMYGNTDGRVANSPMPPFLASSVNNTSLSSGSNRSADEYEKARSQEIQRMAGITAGSVKKIVETWAKNFFIDMTVAASSVTMTLPLDLTWEAGEFYRIRLKSKDGGGTLLFNGLLNNETHTISTRGQNPIATTALTFSHVLIQDNTLPGVD